MSGALGGVTGRARGSGAGGDAKGDAAPPQETKLVVGPWGVLLVRGHRGGTPTADPSAAGL